MDTDFSNIAFEISNGKDPLDVGFLTENIPAEVKAFFDEAKFHVPDCSFTYGFFKNRNKNINGCIIHNLQYTDTEPIVLKNAPSGLAIVESIGPSFIVSVHESKQTPLVSFKFSRSVKLESHSFQYGVFVLRKDLPTGRLSITLGCLLKTPLFKSLSNPSKPFESICSWFFKWWEWHVNGIAAAIHQRKTDLLGKGHQGDTKVDPWRNQVDALMGLTKKDYPKLFALWAKYKQAKTANQKKKIRDAARHAFIAEWKKITGETPKFIDDHGLIHDEAAFTYLSDVSSRKVGSASNQVTWWLAINWTKLELFLMNDEQLAECYFKHTGIKKSPSLMLKYRSLAGLKSLLKRGKKS